MDDKHRDAEFEAIARLIREEEEAALAGFRQRDFGRMVSARLEESKAGKRARFRPWKILIPAGAALLVMAAGSYLLLHRSGPRGTAPETGSFVAVLRELPGLLELASKPAVPPQGAREIPTAPRSIREGLTAAGRQRAGEEENAPLPKGVLDVPRLSMEKKMAILFKDKAIERVLVSIREKSKEV